MPSISLQQIATALDIDFSNHSLGDSVISDVFTDSRAVQAGGLFWAMQGEKTDGHRFVENAIHHGAVGAVIEFDAAKNLQLSYPDFPFLVVPNTLLALGELAGWCRQYFNPFVIGVTGSVGKTTTRRMIHSVLSESFRGKESPRNYNNHVGLPLSLLQLDSEDEYAVVEFGASRLGEVKTLAQIAKPEIGVITSIGASHLASFGSIENVTATKAELIDQLPETGLLILAGDDCLVSSLKPRAGCRVILVGTEPHNDLRATKIEVKNRSLSFQIDGESFFVPATGEHHVIAALVAIAVGQEVGMETQLIHEGLANFQPISGRSCVEQIGDWTILNDCYNANPLSMQAACETASTWKTNGQKVFIAGEMLCLGDDSARYHFEFGQQVAEAGVDFLLALGVHAEDVVRGAYSAGMCASRLAVFEEIDSLFTILSCWLSTDDFVLVKGSRGMHMERVIDWMRSEAECQEQSEPYHIRVNRAA